MADGRRAIIHDLVVAQLPDMTPSRDTSFEKGACAICMGGPDSGEHQVRDLVAQQELVPAGGGCHGVVAGAVCADAHVPPLDVRDRLQQRLRCVGVLGLQAQN